MTLGEQTRNQRLQLHLCQAVLPEILGVKTATICHWEHGLCRPSKRFLFRIRFFARQELGSSGAPIEHVEVKQEPEMVLFMFHSSECFPPGSGVKMYSLDRFCPGESGISSKFLFLPFTSLLVK
jgi:hypothetical protein